ncbi:MAG: ectoine/hydroxyectoine ABC transporter permease subunit EhuC [Arthrobacter sp.]|uniref:ectoine/hydroxyectoine ABC transporter permease subunit EhuC n=1 Tax=unclassified Arthrobacter TaxID=235627 RepID=UPI00264FCB13|nr:ectoine/hydroxyectoine ABC transporter permease subunit EhuC [Micrococcaceae bacterium]MDN5813319.1 ectoine/hydroxyectoine ABC transporter permease subunit EhuC [Micrococcaceae bacterium]MDN5823311.1 ectoine/hydroxyectoine ABC transporter permease subunit EhuC [Micrococcaceae bacterium]MDN5879733.1 ectoine/hydroxyectoine ABC transporter permease subunit EhuC [Micrococcaceae bacterium]MDN5887172.1 ectoine/hydroxyectoine ABC transporter permease subunit EhuC [Micrococcaceae bacterium]
MDEKFAAIGEAMPRLLDGLVVTIELTIFGAIAAFILAVILGLAAASPAKGFRIPARVVIEFFRGTSLVVQVFWLFFVLPLLGIDLHPMLVGVMALGLNYGAYSAEVVRGSIQAVPTGQWEATTALSLGPIQRMRRIIFPQAWALMIPSLSSLLVHLMKGTAIVGFITLADLTYQLEQVKRTAGTLFTYGVVGILSYFVFALVLMYFMNALEHQAKHKLGQGKSLWRILSPAPPASTPAGGAS